MPPPDIAVLREKVRRRAFLVRQRTKLKVKIRGILTYEGVKPPEGYDLYTRKGSLKAPKKGEGGVTHLNVKNPPTHERNPKITHLPSDSAQKRAPKQRIPTQ